MAAPASPSKQKHSAQNGFSKFFAKHKKTPSTAVDITSSASYCAPRLPSLDLNPNNAAVFREQVNNQNTRQKKDNVPSRPPYLGHKKSSSNISVKNLFGDNKNKAPKYFREEQKLVINTDTEDTAKPPKSPTKSKNILKQLQWNSKDGSRDRSPERAQDTDKKGKKNRQDIGERNKENESPIMSHFAVASPNLGKPLPPLSISTAHLPSAIDDIALYTPKIYSASSQRNFHDYNVSLKPRPKSVVAGERKSSWSSIISSRGSINDVRKPSVEIERGRRVSGNSTSRTSSTPSLSMNATPQSSVTSRGSDNPVHGTSLEVAFEALLDTRGIPQNMRSKLRALAPHVKEDFLKQDKEESALKAVDPNASASVREASPKKSKHARNRSESPVKTMFPSFGKSSGLSSRPDSPTKKSMDMVRSDENTRPKSMGFGIIKKVGSSASLVGGGEKSMKRKYKDDGKQLPGSCSTVDLRMNSAWTGSTHSLVAPSTPTGEIYAKRPEEFLEYLKFATPENAEVGWLHKLKLMLRNERLKWVETFLNGGGFDSIVKLLYSLMDIEWRDEHHDKLFDWCLICLKALCTSPLALQILDKFSPELFSRLIALLFDKENRGPSDFTTRDLIVGLLYTHIATASTVQRPVRAKQLLHILSDPVPRESTRPVDFIERIHINRPYKKWCKEVDNVTKEVFWIFLHHQNIIPFVALDPSESFMTAFSPVSRPPVAAAPYVGGVEWDATNYLATHLDLLNVIIASMSTVDERNEVRRDMKNSGWEKVMGGSLRTASIKFYGAVHEGLKTWVSAARADQWEGVPAVRCGIFQENEAPKSPVKKSNSKKDEAKVELPKLEFEMKDRFGGSEAVKEAAIKVDREGEADLGWQF